MALDFSNRDPKDPNGIYSLDTSLTTSGWVKDGDWSTIYDSAAKAKAAGANNPVKIATAITNDGRKFNVILDANGKPISEAGDPVGQDDDRANAWKATAPKPLPPGGSPTQNRNGRVYGYNPTTGQYDLDQGDVPVTRTPDQQRTDAAGATEAETKAQEAVREAAERKKNRELPTDQDPRDETDAQRAARADATRKEQVAKAERDAQQNRGTTILKPDGKGGTVAVTTYPDGRPPTTAAVPGVPSEAQSKYSEVRQDPNSGAWSGLTKDGRWEAIQGGPGATGNQPLPGNLPAYRPDPNQPAMGLTNYVQGLAAMRSQRGPDGAPLLTDQQFKDLVSQAHQQATAEASRLDTIRAAQQQQQTNEISQRNADLNASVNRLNSANTATDNALKTSQAMASNFTNKSYAALDAPLLPGIMGIQDARAGAWGGLDQPAHIGVGGYPMLAQMNQMGMAPAGPIIPAVAQLNNMGNPNQIGAGNIGSAVAPVANGVTATNAAAVNPTGPNVEAANQAVQAGTGAAMGALGIPPVQPPASAPAPGTPPQPTGPGDEMVKVTDKWGNTMTIPRSSLANRPGGTDDLIIEPITQPSAPQAMAQSSNDVLSMTPDQAGSAPMPQGASPILPATQQMGLVSQMHASGKYPPDVIQEAARQLGWM